MALVEQGEVVKLSPVPGFVIKTKVLESLDVSKRPHFTKVFINVCHDSQVPKPIQDFEPSVVFPMIINNSWEIPIITSQEKISKDKKGNPSLVYDCCVNSLCFQWCQINADLRSILIEWCIEAVETMFETVLEREYSLPKMLSKGDLSGTEIRKKELEGTLEEHINELKDDQKAIIGELLGKDEDVDMDDSVLPEIMNIKGAPRRNLIQEIDDEKPRKKLVEEIPLISKEQNSNSMIQVLDDEELGMKPVQTRQVKRVANQHVEANGQGAIPYEIKKTVNGKVIIAQVAEGDDFSVKYNSPQLAITTSGRKVVTIVVGEISSYKAFFQQSDQKLYVFLS